jgi:hypothetical protein
MRVCTITACCITGLAKRRESRALLLNAAATPRTGRTQELASALHRLYRCLLVPSKLLGLSLGRRAIVGTECCRLWRVPVEAMDRHSGSNSSGPTNHRTQNRQWDLQAGAWNCADSLPPFHIFGILSKFQHVIRKCRSVGFQGPGRLEAAVRAEDHIRQSRELGLYCGVNRDSGTLRR